MANTIPSALIPLVLAGSIGVVREEAALLGSIPKERRINLEGDLRGQTINFSKPTAQTAASVTAAATPPALSDTVKTAVSITLSSQYATRFHLTDKEMTQFMYEKDFKPDQLSEAVRAVIYQMSADLFATYKQIYGYAGTAATNPFATTINSAADVRETLNAQFCPRGNRKLVLGYEAETALLKISNINETLKRGDSEALKKGEIGDLFGFRVAIDGQRPTHTAGTNNGAYLVNNGAGYAAGTTSIVIDTGAGTIVEGDIITFAGHTQTYVADAGCTTTLLLLKNALVAAVADNEAITGKATHKVNLAYDPAAFGIGLAKPGPMQNSMDMVDPVTGIPLRLTYLPGYHADQWEVSSWVYGCRCVDPRRAARLAG